MGINRLLLVPSFPVVPYYSNLVFRSDFCLLVLTVVSTEFAVCTLIKLMSASLSGVRNTLNCVTSFASLVPCLISQEPTLADSIEQVGVCSIISGSRFYLASSLFAWYAMPALNWAGVSTVPESHWLSYELIWGVVFSLSGAARAQVDVCE